MRFEELRDRRIVIWGAAREGTAALTELRRRGMDAEFAVTGGREEDEQARERLLAAEVVVKSPGIPRTEPLFAEIEARGVAVTSLTDLWMSENAHRVLGITGTKGKSTTAALSHHLLGSVQVSSTLVGNGGTPVTDGDDAGARVAVTEISSYQAADLETSPRVGVLTSLFPEHLPWHGGYDSYVADKLNMFAHGTEVAVVPEGDAGLADLVRSRTGSGARVVAPSSVGLSVLPDEIVWEDVGTLALAEVPLLGRHNVQNVLLALTGVSEVLGADRSARATMLASVHSFAPLEHRMQVVASCGECVWVDDGLATAPEAVAAALDAHDDRDVTLILGGADRGLSFAPLVAHLARPGRRGAVRIIAVGPAGARWVEEGGAPGVDSLLAQKFGQALEWARSRSSGPRVVLLSPGAPSFDEFADFEERSAAFRAAAREACGSTS